MIAVDAAPASTVPKRGRELDMSSHRALQGRSSADEVHEIETIWGPRCFTRRPGEALHPEREPLATLDEETARKASAVIAIAASSITTPGAITSRSPVFAGEALLPPVGTAAPQAVVARDRLAQRVRCVAHHPPTGSSGAVSDLGVWRMVRPSESGNSSFARAARMADP